MNAATRTTRNPGQTGETYISNFLTAVELLEMPDWSKCPTLRLYRRLETFDVSASTCAITRYIHMVCVPTPSRSSILPYCETPWICVTQSLPLGIGLGLCCPFIDFVRRAHRNAMRFLSPQRPKHKRFNYSLSLEYLRFRSSSVVRQNVYDFH